MLEKIRDGFIDKMNETLSDKVLEVVYNSLKSIEDPTLVASVGGSSIVAVFLEKVLSLKNGIIVRSIECDDYFLGKFDNYKNLIVVSYGGKNCGIRSLLEYSDKKKYLLTSRRSHISKETLLRYHITDRIKSFVAFDEVLVPLAIVCSYYLGENLKVGREDLEMEFSFELSNRVDVVYDYDSRTAAKFLETVFVESGVAHVTLHDKYSLCHGRSNLVAFNDSLVVYLSTKDSDLDKLLLSNIPSINKNVVILSAEESDSVIGDFKLVLKSLALFVYIERTFKKEFVNVKYNKIVSSLYHFKGEFK